MVAGGYGFTTTFRASLKALIHPEPSVTCNVNDGADDVIVMGFVDAPLDHVYVAKPDGAVMVNTLPAQIFIAPLMAGTDGVRIGFEIGAIVPITGVRLLSQDPLLIAT